MSNFLILYPVYVTVAIFLIVSVRESFCHTKFGPQTRNEYLFSIRKFTSKFKIKIFNPILGFAVVAENEMFTFEKPTYNLHGW